MSLLGVRRSCCIDFSRSSKDILEYVAVRDECFPVSFDASGFVWCCIAVSGGRRFQCLLCLRGAHIIRVQFSSITVFLVLFISRSSFSLSPATSPAPLIVHDIY